MINWLNFQNSNTIRVFFLVIVCFVFSNVKGYAQQGNISLDFKDVSLIEIINEIEKSYDYLFSFSQEDILDVSVSISGQYMDISDALSQLFNGTQLNFEIVGEKFILITNKDSNFEETLICAKVFSEEGNEPLPYVNIKLQDAPIGTSTNEKGLFTLSHTFFEGDSIQISYIGFENLVLPYESLINENCKNIYLSLPEYEEAFLVIKDYITDGISLKENGTSTNLNIKNIDNLPGQVEPDVLRMTQFLPGISSPSSKASDIFIRGCTPDQNLIIWEDIPMYHSAHYFGMISAFNPFIIDEVKVYRSGFGANYGGRIAGVIDMRSPNELIDDSYFGVGSNMTHSYIYGAKKIKKKRPTTITYSIRRSFAELWETPTFKNISKINQQGYILGNKEIAELPDNIKIKNDFNFFDAHFKSASQISERDHLIAAGFFTNNKFGDVITDKNANLVQTDNMDLDNLGGSIQWDRSWSDGFSTTLKSIGTSYKYAYNYELKGIESDILRVGGSKSNTIQDLQLHLTGKYEFENNQQVSVGYQLIDYNIDYKVVEISPEGNGRDIFDDGSSKSTLHNLFVEYKNPIQNKLGLSLGLRSTYYDTSKDLFLEPRINIAYKVTSNFNVNANAGRYCQFVGQVTEFKGSNNGLSLPLWALAENMSIPIQSSDSYQLGFVFLKKSWTIDVQGYSRKISGLSSRAYDFDVSQDVGLDVGQADIIGLDVLLKKRFNRVRSWLSYSYSKNDFSFPDISPSQFPSDFDQRHIFKWSNQIDLNQFTIAIGFKLSSGLPFSRLVDFQVTSMPDEVFEYDGVYEGINRSSLPANHQVDISLGYEFGKSESDWKGFIRCSLSNVYDQENIFSRNYYVDTRQAQNPKIDFAEKTNIRFNPNVSVRFEW